MSASPAKRLSTGVAGLDEILLGGLIPGRVYLVRGAPGTGKSTLALHFLSAGVANGERALYISLANPEAKIREDAASMGFSLDGVSFLDLTRSPPRSRRKGPTTSSRRPRSNGSRPPELSSKRWSA